VTGIRRGGIATTEEHHPKIRLIESLKTTRLHNNVGPLDSSRLWMLNDHTESCVGEITPRRNNSETHLKATMQYVGTAFYLPQSKHCWAYAQTEAARPSVSTLG
jgi:hypothetical protein